MTGTTDVAALRETLDPKDVDGWQAYWNSGNDPLIRLIEIVRRGLTATANAFGGKFEPQDIDPWYEDPDTTDNPDDVRL